MLKVVTLNIWHCENQWYKDVQYVRDVGVCVDHLSRMTFDQIREREPKPADTETCSSVEPEDKGQTLNVVSVDTNGIFSENKDHFFGNFNCCEKTSPTLCLR